MVKRAEDEPTKCPACGGNGWRAVKGTPHTLLPGVYEVRCDNCNGFGWIEQEHPSRP